MQTISEVAIVGAGPSGLAAAKYLLAEKKLTVRVFEQRDFVGGVWSHNSLTVLNDDFAIPRTEPSMAAEKPISIHEAKAPQFVTPVYDFLETNIPHTLMNFSDQPFPPNTSLFPTHQTVKQYLGNYAEELRPFIALSTQVLQVNKALAGQERRWAVKTLDFRTGETKITLFDAVVIASGHYSDPFIPDIPGLAAFNEAHPSAVSHSKFYKNPSAFKDKKVIVVGNSASGIDISAQISKVSKLPVIVSERISSNVPSEEEKSWVQYKQEIAECIPSGRQVRFNNGEVESDVDHIMFCTGYFYSFPFLQNLAPPIVMDGSVSHNLYQHLLYTHDPTLAFIGIPQRVVPFPFAEAQAAWVARLWAGRIPAPSPAKMRDWEIEALNAHMRGISFHDLRFPKDVNYINMLHGQSTAANSRPGLENDGTGKPPPYWGEEEAWTRERFPLIKLASRRLGDQRHTVTSLKQLGFDYSAARADNI